MGICHSRWTWLTTGLQAADMYAYVWNRQLTGALNSEYLTRAFAVLTKKKKNIVVAGRRYFNGLISAGNRHRQAGIESERAKGS